MDSLAGLVGAGLEDGRDGVSVADGAEVFFTGRLRDSNKTGGFRSCCFFSQSQMFTTQYKYIIYSDDGHSWVTVLYTLQYDPYMYVFSITY